MKTLVLALVAAATLGMASSAQAGYYGHSYGYSNYSYGHSYNYYTPKYHSYYYAPKYYGHYSYGY